MATVKKGILTLARQRWKHLRKWKRVFWKTERKAQARDTAKRDCGDVARDAIAKATGGE